MVVTAGGCSQRGAAPGASELLILRIVSVGLKDAIASRGWVRGWDYDIRGAAAEAPGYRYRRAAGRTLDYGARRSQRPAPSVGHAGKLTQHFATVYEKATQCA